MNPVSLKTISVIVPCYNHEKYLLDSLNSVLNQTASLDELIIIDDCSKDNSFSLATSIINQKLFKEKIPNILCIKNEENIGAHATINKGVNLSKSEYIAVLNSDDIFMENRLERLTASMSEAGKELSFSNYQFINRESKLVIEHPLWSELQDYISLAKSVFPNLSFSFLQKQIALSTGNLVFTKKLFHKVGGFIDLKYCHDWDFILQSLRYTAPLFVDEALYKYRVHDSNSFSGLTNIAEFESAYVLTRFFRECQLHGAENISAPTKKNWPGLFEVIVKNQYLKDIFSYAETNYRAGHKTIER
jgi:glycosyltransferase involved in cell wall biosynthesis